MNNGGGQIFKRMFKDDLYLNSHDYSFESWAQQWRLSYRRMESVQSLTSFEGTSSEPQVIEIVPSAQQTARFWNAWEPPT